MPPTSPLRILSIIPPMTQLNTPYPSTAYLTGFLRSRGIEATQDDIALKLVLELFSPAGLRDMHERVKAIPPKKRSATLQCFDEQFERYLATITPAVAFLQGRDPSIGHRICGRNFLPEGPRFESLDVFIDDEGGDQPDDGRCDAEKERVEAFVLRQGDPLTVEEDRQQDELLVDRAPLPVIAREGKRTEERDRHRD
mgnify:CR=1 FL=1